MVEKKLVIDGLRFMYDGMFDINEFFREVDAWTDENKYERETKKKLEHVYPDGKRLEYVFEIWKDLNYYARITVRVRALFRDVVDFRLERNDAFRYMQKGHVLVVIDGFVETDIEDRWQQKPAYVFIRTAYEKFIWKFWFNRYDGMVVQNGNSMYNRLFNFFKRHHY